MNCLNRSSITLILPRAVNTCTQLGNTEGYVLLREVRSRILDGIQLQINCVSNSSDVQGQRKLEIVPSLGEDLDEFDKPPIPDGPRENFDNQFFPDVSPVCDAGDQKVFVRSLEIRVTSITAFPDVLCDTITKLLHPSLDRLAIRANTLRISHPI